MTKLTKEGFLAARVLSGRPEPSILEKEEMLTSILGKVQATPVLRPPRTAPLRWALITGAAGVLLVAGVVLLLDSQPSGEFQSRGSPATPGGFALRCITPGAQTIVSAQECRPDHKLVFQLDPLAGMPSFAAFSRSEADGIVRWYLPESEQSRSISASEPGPGGVLGRGVMLDDHPPGRYLVSGVFCDRPRTRGELRSLLGQGHLAPGSGCVVRTEVFQVGSR